MIGGYTNEAIILEAVQALPSFLIHLNPIPPIFNIPIYGPKYLVLSPKSTMVSWGCLILEMGY
jgi:hypothetical protein